MMATTMAIGNTSTLVTFNKNFDFTKMDAGEIDRIKKAAFMATKKGGAK